MIRVAIIAAMPRELKPLVRGWKHERRRGDKKTGGVDLWRWQFDEGEWVAACAGVGQDLATKAFAEIEKDGPISLAISTGWAGSIHFQTLPGKAYRTSGVIDAKTGERFLFQQWSPERPLLVTSPKVAGRREKERLSIDYYAGLVDMEAAAIARLAAMRGIPFYCIKGVSDGLTDHLPDFNRFISPQGRFQLARFTLFAILRPWYWPALLRMGENSRQASQNIAESLLDLLDERGHIRKRNGYPNFQT